MRAVLAENLLALLDRRYAGEANLTARQRALSRDAGLSLSTIQRIAGQEVGASIDSLESIAKVFRVAPAALLTPYAGHGSLDADPPLSGRDGLHRRAS